MHGGETSLNKDVPGRAARLPRLPHSSSPEGLTLTLEFRRVGITWDTFHLFNDAWEPLDLLRSSRVNLQGHSLAQTT